MFYQQLSLFEMMEKCDVLLEDIISSEPWSDAVMTELGVIIRHSRGLISVPPITEQYITSAFTGKLLEIRVGRSRPSETERKNANTKPWISDPTLIQKAFPGGSQGFACNTARQCMHVSMFDPGRPVSLY